MAEGKKPDAAEWAERIWQQFCDNPELSCTETIAEGMADFQLCKMHPGAPSRREAEVSTELAVGQIWQECNPRFTRLVRIIELPRPGFDKVIIETGSFRGALWEGIRRTRASISRFNGKRGGYILKMSAV